MRVYQENVVSVGINLTAVDCPSCGVVFGIASDLDWRRRQDGQVFYCSNGHPSHYGD
jgi:hypothetical protein